MDDLAVPPEAESIQRAQDFVGGAGYAARPVEVLDAAEPAAAGRTGIEPARHRGNERAHVQRPGGRWGEPPDVHRGLESTLPTFSEGTTRGHGRTDPGKLRRDR